jgi:hypothetical protein
MRIARRRGTAAAGRTRRAGCPRCRGRPFTSRTSTTSPPPPTTGSQPTRPPQVGADPADSPVADSPAGVADSPAEAAVGVAADHGDRHAPMTGANPGTGSPRHSDGPSTAANTTPADMGRNRAAADQASAGDESLSSPMRCVHDRRRPVPGEFIVAAAQILQQRVPGCDGAQRAGHCQPAH